MTDVDALIEQLYKAESAKLLAVLTRIFGVHNFDLAEDVLQEAYSKAMIDWQRRQIPENPAAWLMTTAKNQALDKIRANKTKVKFSQDLSQYLDSEWTLAGTIEEEFTTPKIKDDQLRMIFICCHQSIKAENRIVFILKSLCGFSIRAIARALLLTESTVKKRLLRTREKLKQLSFELPCDDKLSEAMDTVHTVLYLLFNEGFYSTDTKNPINIEFCQEAIALVKMLINEPNMANQDTLGLFALMHFNIARINARVDEQGFNIPLDLQDRNLWQQAYMNTGDHILKMCSKTSITPSRFYFEALIAQQHCCATTFAETNWSLIVGYYDDYINITNSPVAKLNQAVALGHAGKVSEAISRVELLQNHKALANSHMPLAVLAYLNAKVGNEKLAYQQADCAKKIGGTEHEHRLMMQQLQRLLN
jgi:RNA polymerase sigma-70 factor (ECF subfamily)